MISIPSIRSLTLSFFMLRGSIINSSEQKPQKCLPLLRQIQGSSHSAINAGSKFHFFHFQILHNIFHLFIYLFFLLCFCFVFLNMIEIDSSLKRGSRIWQQSYVGYVWPVWFDSPEVKKNLGKMGFPGNLSCPNPIKFLFQKIKLERTWFLSLDPFSLTCFS